MVVICPCRTPFPAWAGRFRCRTLLVVQSLGLADRTNHSPLVLRPIGGRFFGKIIKVNVTVTPCPMRIPPRLRRFLVPGWLLVCGLGSVVAWAEEPPAAASVYGRQAAAGGGDAAMQAERIVTASCRRLAEVDSLVARTRQKVRIGRHSLVGGGRYVQSGVGEDQRYRSESMLTADSETFEQLEVCDGLFAWKYRKFGSEPPQLQRIDVRRVRSRLMELKISQPEVAAPYLGGLQRSLWSTRQWFSFHAAAVADLDGIAVWQVDGRLNPTALGAVVPALKESATRPEGTSPEDVPEDMPWAIRISVGKADMVPRRIEWLAIPGPRPVPAGTLPEPIAVLELYDVQIGGPVDASAFVYRPATEGLIDLTDGYVQGLGPLRP